ncbi:MAG: hypothetical protein FWG98_13360 [Candidatus Cloacimonetes bacterium]|nr:hypothetical protein [Candidatus Cloacimonadota bacterium]
MENISFHTYGMENHVGGVVLYIAIDPFGMVRYVYHFIPTAWKIMVGGVVFYIAIDPFGMVRYVYIVSYLWHGKSWWVVSFST